MFNNLGPILVLLGMSIQTVLLLTYAVESKPVNNETIWFTILQLVIGMVMIIICSVK